MLAEGFLRQEQPALQIPMQTVKKRSPHLPETNAQDGNLAVSRTCARFETLGTNNEFGIKKNT